MLNSITRNPTTADDPPSVTRRLRKITPKTTTFVNSTDMAGRPLSSYCTLNAERVVVAGPSSLPTPDAGAGGWTLASHYAEAERSPLVRYRHRNGRRCEIITAASWFGDALGHLDAELIRAGWHTTARMLARTFSGAVMLTTPGATGQDCWLRSLPRDARYVAPPANVAARIRAGAGQGRTELLADQTEPTIPGLYEYDARLQYLGLMRELPGNVTEWAVDPRVGLTLAPGGDPTHRTTTHTRARYKATVQVPADWAHVGLAGVHDGRGWAWPAAPGHRVTAWLDAVELATVYKWWGTGAVVGIHERILYEQGRPLDNLAAGLVRMIADIDLREQGPAGVERIAGMLARAAVRNIALHLIGSLVGKPRAVTRRQPLTAGRPATGEQHRIDGTDWVWTEHVASVAPWLAHPHMAATVWARARSRLLDSPGEQGALHLPRRHLVAFRTDAIYTSWPVHNWTDNGRVGRFRLKAAGAGPFPTPANQTELLALRDRQTGF